MPARCPKILWLLWLQGWDQAPEVARASVASWRGSNPGWQVNALDRDSLARFMPEPDLRRILASNAPPEALSDLVRFELLHRFGGVWADATTICAKPLDEWIADAVGPSGFFAFARPTPDRMVATWFLCARAGTYIIREWRRAAALYWQGRSERGEYFWPHRLFQECHDSDELFSALWSVTPKLDARNIFHFGPDSEVLKHPITPEYSDSLNDIQVPVIKLTHKFEGGYEENSFISDLCRLALSRNPSRADPVASRRILIGWYGAFAGHGTIGDLRAMEVLTTHLVARGHDVSHASAMPVDVPGAERVDWRTAGPSDFDVVLFVCGPIIRGHQQSAGFFAHFRGTAMAGVAVSMFPVQHPLHVLPFDRVFAREGMPEVFGDLAVLAPLPAPLPAPVPVPVLAPVLAPGRANAAEVERPAVVGLALRGPQAEYGVASCRWRETEALARAVAAFALDATGGTVVEIENHLARSGRSPAAIEADYAGCDLVITSRFHGAIEAMRFDVPFIAIDHIEGGAKVVALLETLGWPHVYRIDEADADHLGAVAHDLLRRGGGEALVRSREVAVLDANRTLAALDEWLASLR